MQNHVTFEEAKQRYSVSNQNDQRKRKYTRYFFLPNVNEERSARISVCQKMFLGTLGYSSDEVLRTLQSSTDEVEVVQGSKRGKKKKMNRKHKITFDDEEIIRNNIKKYNLCVSHYRREHAPNRLYLPSELSITDMFEDYKICCEENRKVYLYIKYWRILKKMNISFARLGTEECEVCEVCEDSHSRRIPKKATDRNVW